MGKLRSIESSKIVLNFVKIYYIHNCDIMAKKSIAHIIEINIDRLAKANLFIYSLSLCAIIYLIRIFLFIIKRVFLIPDIEFRERIVNENLTITVDLIIDTLIIAPLVETLVFQTLFFYFFKKFNIHKWIIVLLSAIAFGAYHNYSIFYMIHTGITGFVFMYMYIVRAEMDNKPFLSTATAHFTLNLTITIIIIVAHLFKNQIFSKM